MTHPTNSTNTDDLRQLEDLCLRYDTALAEYLPLITAAMRESGQRKRQHKPRRPTLASLSKQASKAGIAVTRYEVKPDGSIVIVTGQPESATESNPWFDDLKVTKQ